MHKELQIGLAIVNTFQDNENLVDPTVSALVVVVVVLVLFTSAQTATVQYNGQASINLDCLLIITTNSHSCTKEEIIQRMLGSK